MRQPLGENLLSLARAWLHKHREWEPSDTDPQAFWALARRHGLDGMAGGLVATGARLPESLSQLALQTYCTNTLRYQQSLHVCRAICDAAASAGIPLCFVKGPALAGAYGDEGVRAFGDLDVLVPDGDAARALCEQCGFAIRHGAVDVPSRFWKRATGIGRVEAASEKFKVEFTFAPTPANEPLYEFYQRWPGLFLLPAGAGDTIPIPRPEAHLLFLLQHLAQHWCDRVVWLVDFAVLMRNGAIDTAWLEYAAAQLEMRKLLRAVTVFCRRHLDDSIPELGCGPTGWKDGLYLSLLSPDAFSRTALHKYGHQRGGAIKDALLGAFQHLFATDLELPTMSRRRTAPRWMGEWLQHVLFPGGSITTRIGPVVAPAMFVVMALWVCVVFRKSPRGFARLARRRLHESSVSSQPVHSVKECHAIP